MSLLLCYTFLTCIELIAGQISTVYVSKNCSPDEQHCYDDLDGALQYVSRLPKQDGFQIFMNYNDHNNYDDSMCHLGGQYHLNESYTFTNLTSVTISKYKSEGQQDDVKVEILCSDSNASIAFIYSRNIVISGLAFSNCGGKYNSTTIEQNSSQGQPIDKYVEFYAVLYVAFCTHLTLSDCEVTKSKGIAVQMYSVGGVVSIDNNNFTDNPYNSSLPKGGGLYIEMAYCSPFDFAACINSRVSPDIAAVTKASYTISKNTFHNNVAKDMFKGYVFTFPDKKDYNVFGRGGGLSLFIHGNSSYNTFTIDSNTFTDNHAVYGGGMLIEYHDNANHNNLTINNCTFNSSTVLQGGGGVRLSQFSHATGNDNSQVLHNHVEVSNCHFFNNTAEWGGGMSIEVTKEKNLIEPTNSISFTHCIWINNRARLGAGLDISCSHSYPDDIGVLVNVVLHHVTFNSNVVNTVKNRMVIENKNSTILGYGVLYANSVSITLQNETIFFANEGAGLMLVDNTVMFAPGCRAVFKANVARDGPGITIFGFSTLIIASNTSLRFISNEATNEGGAIFAFRAGGRNMYASRDCFLRYIDPSVDPPDWDTTIEFDSNKANNKLNAIFTTSIYPCLWESSSKVRRSAKDAFCSNTFIYKPNTTECYKQITTDTESFKMKTEPPLLQVFPGKEEPLNIVAYNDEGVDVTKFLVLSAHVQNTDSSSSYCEPQCIFIDDYSKYITNNAILLKQVVNCNTSKNNTIILESDGPRVIVMEIPVQFRECPPGLQSSLISVKAAASCYIGTIETKSCECVPNGAFYGFVYCNIKEFRAYILKGYWIGKTNDVNATVKVGQCKYCTKFNFSNSFHHHVRSSHIGLEDSFNATEELLCGAKHREGILCGNCKEGYAPAFNSYDHECVECTSATRLGWFLYVLVRIIFPFTLFLCFFIFRFSLASGFLNGPIFFAQIISSVTIVNFDVSLAHISNTAFKKVYYTLYGIWNLDFCTSCFNMPCLHPKITSIDLLLLEYCISFVPLLTVLFLKIMDWLKYFKEKPMCNRIPCVARFMDSRLFAKLTSKSMIGKGIVASIILTYNKIAVLTGYLLSPTPLYDVHAGLVEQSYTSRTFVLFANGTIEFNSGSHIKFAIPVTIISAIFLVFIPLILLVYRYERLDKNTGFFNVIHRIFQKDFRVCSRCEEYSDGSHDLQQFSVNMDQQDMQASRSVQNPAYNLLTKTINKSDEFQPNIEKICCCKVNFHDNVKYKFKHKCCPPFSSFKVTFYHGSIRFYTAWGHDEYRWVPALYFYVRLMFILAYMFAVDPMSQLVLQIVLSVLLGFFFLAFRPYKRGIHNAIEGSVYLLLATILQLQLYEYNRSALNQRNLQFVVIVKNFLTLCPFFWITGYIIYRICKQLKSIRKGSCCSLSCQSSTFTTTNGEHRRLINNDT